MNLDHSYQVLGMDSGEILGVLTSFIGEDVLQTIQDTTLDVAFSVPFPSGDNFTFSPSLFARINLPDIILFAGFVELKVP